MVKTEFATKNGAQLTQSTAYTGHRLVYYLLKMSIITVKVGCSFDFFFFFLLRHYRLLNLLQPPCLSSVLFKVISLRPFVGKALVKKGFRNIRQAWSIYTKWPRYIPVYNRLSLWSISYICGRIRSGLLVHTRYHDTPP